MTFWKGKKVLVTGANGFVGSHLTKALVEQGATVVSLIRDEIPNSYLAYSGTEKKIVKVRGDLTDFELVRRTVSQYAIEYIFHLAAQAIVTTANKSPIPTFNSNITGTINLLEAARLSDSIKGVIVASTDKAYGKHEVLPYKEDAPLDPKYPYDVSKACAEIIAKSYWHTYGLPVGITRCCNIYGEGDLNFTRIIPDAIRSTLHGRNPVIRSNGSPIREYIHVDDVVSAYLTFAEQLTQKNLQGHAFNFGSGEKASVLDVVKKIIGIVNPALSPEVQGKGNPHGEIDAQYLSSEKAHTSLHWKAKVSFDEGMKRTIKWYKEYLEKTSVH